MVDWKKCHWFIVFNGIADAWLWGFDADGWRLRHRDPAMGRLGIFPIEDAGPTPGLTDALWLADALAFDHDAPVGVRPAFKGEWPAVVAKDPEAVPPSQPIEPYTGPLVTFYWESLQFAHATAADLRFGSSYAIRYECDSTDPGTNFRDRFRGRETRLAMYAMAARQADLLAEYLCLYRILEDADLALKPPGNGNGTAFAACTLPTLLDRDFGELGVVSDDMAEDGSLRWINAFEIYKDRAEAELDRLRAEGVDDVSAYLYGIRNRLAHGKRDIIAGTASGGFQDTARVLPIVKLLARVAVETV